MLCFNLKAMLGSSDASFFSSSSSSAYTTAALCDVKRSKHSSILVVSRGQQRELEQLTLFLRSHVGGGCFVVEVPPDLQRCGKNENNATQHSWLGSDYPAGAPGGRKVPRLQPAFQ